MKPKLKNSTNIVEKIRYLKKIEIGDHANFVLLPSKTFHHGRVYNERMYEVRLIEHSEIREVYSKTCSLRELFDKFSLKPRLAQKVLLIAGVDFPADLATEYRAGKSINALAKKHGMKEKTVSNILKSVGVNIRSGNTQIRPQKDELERVFRKFGTIKGVAKTLGVHQNTAKKFLVEADLLPGNTKNTRA